jgi:cytoskeletal protein CcmA (bactofilin family)
MLAFLALFAVTLAWFLLPMLPALRELIRPTDTAPLQVVDRSSGYVAYFARNFRSYLDKQMAALPAEAQVGDYLGKMPDGTQFIRVHKSAEALAHEAETTTQNRLVVLDAPLTLPGNEMFLMEVYARAALIGGPNAVYRAIYAERDLGLGEASKVLRWAHAGGTLGVSSHSVLRGRVTSDKRVVLGHNVVFERIGAPVISVTRENEPPPHPPSSPKEFRLPEGSRRVGDHMRVTGDLDIPEGVRFLSSLVVSGTLRIGMGAIVEGSVKAHRDVELADEAQVRGAVVARRRIMVGAAAWIGGPVIAEERIRLGRGTVVGGPNLPATVSAPEVELANGATVYGQISAPMGGRTF